jgi:GT2 family glycosyltransferase
MIVSLPGQDQQAGDDTPRSPLVSIIVVNHNGLHLLQRTLPSIAWQDYPYLDVIVVDNASTDGSLDYVTEFFPMFKCTRAKINLHYTKAMNLGIKKARGGLLLLMNNDVVLDRFLVSSMIAASRDHPEAGIFGPKTLFYGTSFIQSAAGRLYPRTQRVPSSMHSRIEPVDWIFGAAWMIRRSVLERVGLLDEENYTAYHEETDFQMRARKNGISLMYVPSALAWHRDGATMRAGSESWAYHSTRGAMSFNLIHKPFKDIIIGLVYFLGISVIDIAAGAVSAECRRLLARGRLFALLNSLKRLARTLRRRMELEQALKKSGAGQP